MSILWSKIRRDLLQNRVRSLTIILTITLGVFALGLVMNLYITLSEKMLESLRISDPSHLQFSVTDISPLQLQRLKQMFDVAAIEPVRMAPIQWKTAPDEDWSTGVMIARDNYVGQQMNLIDLDMGDWPGRREASVERLTSQYYGLDFGTSILVKTPSGLQQSIPLTGVIHSVQAASPRFGGSATFYVNAATLESLTGVSRPNLVDVKLNYFTQDAAKYTAEKIKADLDLKNPVEISDPSKHPRQGQVQAFCLVLGAMGAGILGLSILLIINVFQAMMLQQIRQIGSLKTIGADTWQVVRIYLTISLIYGCLSILVAIPLSTLAGWKLSGLLLQLLNIDSPKLEIIPLAWTVQVVVGLCVPVIASLFPVFEGARITVRQAIQSYGVNAPFGHHWLEKMLLNLQGLSLALALSGRNALRSKQRSLLTLAMMTISGLLFISVMSLKGSFQSTLMEMASTFHYDVEIDFAAPQRSGEIRQLAARIPEVTYTEMHWTGEQAIKFENTNERSVSLRALPPDSQIYTPKVVAGRWLAPGDGQTMVLNARIAEEEGVSVGDYVSMTSDGKSTKWQVVGLVFDTSNRQRTAFVSLRTFARIKQQEGLATDLMIQTSEQSDAAQEMVEKSLVDLYEKHNLLLLYTTAFNTMMAQQLAPFDILVYLFLSMSILAALVGGLGLMGAMLLSVKERTREIGVMRAVGGDSWEISKIFVSEGLMLGFSSWLIAMLLSTPVSRVFAQAIGVVMFGLPLNENISLYGIVLWLIIVLLISALASAWPALQAARVSVRESLAYE